VGYCLTLVPRGSFPEAVSRYVSVVDFVRPLNRQPAKYPKSAIAVHLTIKRHSCTLCYDNAVTLLRTTSGYHRFFYLVRSMPVTIHLYFVPSSSPVAISMGRDQTLFVVGTRSAAR